MEERESVRFREVEGQAGGLKGVSVLWSIGVREEAYIDALIGLSSHAARANLDALTLGDVFYKNKNKNM